MKQFLNEGTEVRFDSMCMILKQAKLINILFNIYKDSKSFYKIQGTIDKKF